MQWCRHGKTGMKLSIACLAACCILATPAMAQKMLVYNMRAVLPPEQFDHIYAGRTYITRLDQEAIKQRCPSSVFGTLACSFLWPSKWGKDCEIVLVNDIEKQLKDKHLGFDLAIALRHEIGHCNGWPANHPNAREF